MMPMNSSKRCSLVFMCARAHLRRSIQLSNCACLFVYRPERWEAIPEAVKAIPGVFSNIMTFINGAHTCIGYRFAVAE